jgi:large subunit ribosomal protein L25
MADTLQVENRDIRGRKRLRRLRATGVIPAVLYGHKLDSISLSVSGSDVEAVIGHGARMVDLKGAVNESALIRDVQWDTFGTELIHVDFARVAADERVEMVVQVELRGEAPGIKQGGVVQHLLHEVHVECPAGKIPEKIDVSINDLALDQTIRIGDLELDESIKILEDESRGIVQCVLPVEHPDEMEEALGDAAAEPEVIGKKEIEGEESAK